MFFNDLPCFTSFLYLFFLPFCHFALLHTYFVTGATLGSEDPGVNKTGEVPTLMKLTLDRRRQLAN